MLLGIGVSSFGGGDAILPGLGIMAAALVVMGGGMAAVGLSRRLQAPTAFDVLQKDQRPPVLYCRPFIADNRFLEGGSEEEEAIARIFSNMGPTVTVGRPGDRLRSAGAARMYLKEDEWPEVVADLMTRARLILIKAVPTDHVLWELKTAAANGPMFKIVLIPPATDDEWIEFRNAVDWLQLPQDLGGAGVLCFDTNGTPRRLFSLRHVKNWWQDDNLVQRVRFLTSL